MKRKIMTDLMEWKISDDKKCLMIMGARQVGKTFIVNEFSATYKNYLSINFETEPAAKKYFDGDLTVESILMRLSLAYPNVDLEPGSTLIFLDEIQSCPNAVVSLKSFTIDGKYDVIASGSLMGLNYKKIASYPVGYVNIMTMRSMDFEEFLWALGVKDDILDHVRKCIGDKVPIDDSVVDIIDGYFRQFMVVGGMPEAVVSFVKTKNFSYVRKIHSEINRMYLSDIAKYAPPSEKTKAAACLRSIVSQISKDNKRFNYSEVLGGKNSNASTLGGSLAWLNDAGLTEYCYRLNEPMLPLECNTDIEKFKVYYHDTGLLLSMMAKEIGVAVITDDSSVNKGALMENAVAEALIKNGVPLTYFTKANRMEIDFIVILGGTVTALEVKSGNNRQAKSLHSIMSAPYRLKRGIKLEKTNIYVDDEGVEHYPVFAAAFIRCIS